jgi:hypothetical protein
MENVFHLMVAFSFFFSVPAQKAMVVLLSSPFFFNITGT